MLACPRISWFVRTGRLLPLLGALLLATSVHAQAPAGTAEPFALPTDPVLEELLQQSLAARPELQQAQALVSAERERIPQAGALPDPSLTLGIQNDGFRAIQIGEMETSYLTFMATQAFPWPGKRGLRTEVATLGARQAEASRRRARLDVEADVRRAYIDLLLVRERLGLLSRLEALWAKSGGLARARYETGEGAQPDLLRAQLELSRLRQRRWALEAEERTRVQMLNRLRSRPLDEAVVTGATLRDLADPLLPGLEEEMARAEALSPELAGATLGTEQASRALALARKERLPDFAVSAGIMPRGGLEPMWQAGLSLNLPLFAGRKQNRAVAEQEARAEAARHASTTVAHVLHLRVNERRAALEALLPALRLYREGLLVQSQATAESTLAQYRVGRVTFASVLEALAGYLADEEAYLAAVADAQRLAVARAVVSLEPAGAGGGGATGGSPLPGAGVAGGMAAPAATGAPAAGTPAETSSSSMSRM